MIKIYRVYANKGKYYRGRGITRWVCELFGWGFSADTFWGAIWGAIKANLK